jgi:hypothetical protein
MGDLDQAIASKALRYAEAYALLGWRILPVTPGGKQPLNGQGIDHATTDLNAIRTWFTERPDANIGIRLDTADLFAVDIDPRNGGSLELINELPPTLTAKTGGGGMHLLYRMPNGAQVPGRLRQGVDIKYRGYIVVEPSRHPSGGTYNWQDWDVLEGEGPPEIAHAPPIVFGGANEHQQRRAPMGAVGPGERNEYLSREAFKLRKLGLPVSAIEAALLVMNREKCSPPLEEHEVRAIAKGKARVAAAGARLEDFYAHMPSHTYLYVPTRELWPSASVSGRCEWPVMNGKPVAPAAWLDKHRPIEQLVWCPGEPDLIHDRVMQVSGWSAHQGTTVFNMYKPPAALDGDAAMADPWINHAHRVFPDDADHIIKWLAHRVQNPGEKCNHALVLGGAQGIGKDTLLEPVKMAVGPWNWSDINPSQMLGRFNGWVKAVIVRVNEARDLGDVDRFGFYDHSKTYIAAPPDVLRVDEKHLRETYVANACGVVITTNHATDGLYLPADDRRHYVAWSPRTREDFEAGYWPEFYRWMAEGGTGHVAAYLRGLDLSEFDPKAPPPKTPAFWNVVAAGEAPESGELRDVIEKLANPDAMTLARVIEKAEHLGMHGLVDELRDRKALRTIPHKMERAGYVAVRNPDAEDGKFRINERRTPVYARRTLTVSEQIRAARRLT